MRETIGYKRNHNEREKDDFYATSPSEVENILQYETLHGVILENSCGMGHMAKVVKKKYPNNRVIATDIANRGYGEIYDFLADDYPYTDVNTIIMNPPFKFLEQFVLKSLSIAKDKVILLARVQFLESVSRYEKIFRNNPPSTIYLYVDRIACAKGGDFGKYQSSSMAYAWFVWDKNDRTLNTKLQWIRRLDKQKISLFDEEIEWQTLVQKVT